MLSQLDIAPQEVWGQSGPTVPACFAMLAACSDSNEVPTEPGHVNRLTLLTAAELTGQFDQIRIDDVPLNEAHQGGGFFRSLEILGEEVTLVDRRAFAGDANGDGFFNSEDLIEVFTIGHYEDGIPDNSDWTEGDWDGDQDFTSGDLVTALAAGYYDAGSSGSVAVPEPHSFMWPVVLLLTLASRRRID